MRLHSDHSAHRDRNRQRQASETHCSHTVHTQSSIHTLCHTLSHLALCDFALSAQPQSHRVNAVMGVCVCVTVCLHNGTVTHTQSHAVTSIIPAQFFPQKSADFRHLRTTQTMQFTNTQPSKVNPDRKTYRRCGRCSKKLHSSRAQRREGLSTACTKSPPPRSSSQSPRAARPQEAIRTTAATSRSAYSWSPKGFLVRWTDGFGVHKSSATASTRLRSRPNRSSILRKACADHATGTEPRRRRVPSVADDLVSCKFLGKVEIPKRPRYQPGAREGVHMVLDDT